VLSTVGSVVGERLVDRDLFSWLVRLVCGRCVCRRLVGGGRIGGWGLPCRRLRSRLRDVALLVGLLRPLLLWPLLRGLGRRRLALLRRRLLRPLLAGIARLSLVALVAHHGPSSIGSVFSTLLRILPD
jgi:hypothetical protein